MINLAQGQTQTHSNPFTFTQRQWSLSCNCCCSSPRLLTIHSIYYLLIKLASRQAEQRSIPNILRVCEHFSLCGKNKIVHFCFNQKILEYSANTRAFKYLASETSPLNWTDYWTIRTRPEEQQLTITHARRKTGRNFQLRSVTAGCSWWCRWAGFMDWKCYQLPVLLQLHQSRRAQRESYFWAFDRCFARWKGGSLSVSRTLGDYIWKDAARSMLGKWKVLSEAHLNPSSKLAMFYYSLTKQFSVVWDYF